MKKVITLFLLSLLCTLLLVACDTPEPPEQPTLDEQITVGMSYVDVSRLIGNKGTAVEISPNVCFWNTGDEKDLYVWFTRPIDDSTATVTRVERCDDLVPDVGMSLDEVKALLGSAGTTYGTNSNIHTWPSASENALYVWLDSDDKVLKYLISQSPNAKVGMTYEQVSDFFDCEGTPVANVSGLYSWPDFFPGEIAYVRFLDGVATDVFMDSEISVEVGLTYERLTYIYKSEGTKVGRWDNIYSWSTSEGKIGLFKFADDNGSLKLSQFVPSIADISVGMTFSELNESLGAVGVDAGITTTKVYKWDTELEENLFVWLDSDMTVTQFCYAKDEDLELKVGMPRDDAFYILGQPSPIRHRWVTTADTDLYIRFDNDARLFEVIDIPKLDIYIGMTWEYIVEMVGKEPERSRGSGVIYYIWILDDSGLEMDVSFYGEGATAILFYTAENQPGLESYPYPYPSESK